MVIAIEAGGRMMFGFGNRRKARQAVGHAASVGEGVADALGAGGASWIGGAIQGPLQGALSGEDPDLPPPEPGSRRARRAERRAGRRERRARRRGR
jgi:hypothetical protein